MLRIHHVCVKGPAGNLPLRTGLIPLHVFRTKTHYDKGQEKTEAAGFILNKTARIPSLSGL